MNPISVDSPRQLRDRAMSRARERLDLQNNRLMLIVGILICILVTVGIFMIEYAINDALKITELFIEPAAVLLFDVVNELLCFVFVYPLYLGLLGMALDITNGKRADLGTVFVYFSSFRMLARAWGIQIRIVLNAIPLLVAIAFPYALPFLENSSIYGLVHVVVWAVQPILIFWGFYSSSRIFFFAILALKNSEPPLGQIMKQAKKSVCGRVFSVCAMRLRMIWRILVSLLSVGVVTLLHVLPLTLLTYGEYASTLTEDSF